MKLAVHKFHRNIYKHRMKWFDTRIKWKIKKTISFRLVMHIRTLYIAFRMKILKIHHVHRPTYIIIITDGDHVNIQIKFISILCIYLLSSNIPIDSVDWLNKWSHSGTYNVYCWMEWLSATPTTLHDEHICRYMTVMKQWNSTQNPPLRQCAVATIGHTHRRREWNKLI